MSLFGGLFGGSAPKFDASAAINAQQGANNTATANNAKAANAFGPYGSATTQVDANGMPTGQTKAFSGPLNTASGNIQGDVATASSWLPQNKFSLSDVPTGKDYGDAVFNQSMAYTAPYFQQQQKLADETLTNRGLPAGSEAYTAGMAPVLDAQSRALVDAGNRATMAGYDQRQREIGNTLTERNQGYQDVNSGIGLLGGMGSLLPQTQQVGQQTPVNAMGAYEKQFEGDMNAYNQKQQGINNALKLGVGLMTAPMTGGTSLFGAMAKPVASGASNLFNGKPWGYGSSWDAAVSPVS